MGMLGCIVIGSSMATLVNWYSYPTNYRFIGILLAFGLGASLLVISIAVSESKRSRFLYLVTYSALFGALLLSVSVLIHFFSDLSARGLLKSFILLLISLSVLFVSRKSIMKANLK
jgi:hypothetical protein